jgi:hypothetical protein
VDDAVPTPEARAKSKSIRGTPVAICAATWLMAEYPPDFGPHWDDLYDQNLIRGCYDPDDLRMAALRLLMANYRLDAEEAVALVLAAEPAALVPAVERALFGEDRPHRTWSDWALGSLLINGIRPESIPPEMLHATLDLLVAAGRTVPESRFVTSQVTAAKRAAIMEKAEPF